MTYKNDFHVETVNHHHENADSISTFIDTITTSCELVDIAIEDVRNYKKTLDSTIDVVIDLMKEVECKEKAAEQAKEEADRCNLRTLAKVDELNQARQRAKETNDMHAREVYAQKAVLAKHLEELQFRVSAVLKGDKSVGLLDEMCSALKERLTIALIEKEFTETEKVAKELFGQQIVAYEVSQMEAVIEESEKLKQESDKIRKLQEFLIDRGQVVDVLSENKVDRCEHVKLLKHLLDLDVPLSQVLSYSRKSSVLASSSSLISPCHESQIRGGFVVGTLKEISMEYIDSIFQ